ncbi:MAG: hypothetical protein HY841_03915 [Bacteroidetes bacterium]|nr:hypothetical protein [Bacteroidota bacterium]
MKKLIGLLMILTLITLSTYNLVTPEQTPPAKQDVTKKKITIIQKQKEKTDNEYRQTVHLLLRENDSLEFAVKYAKEKLKKSKSKVFALQNKINATIEKQKIETDTASKLAYCDSLKSEVTNLLVQSTERDSLCGSTIVLLTAQVQNRDSSFSICEKSYSEMKNLLDNSLQQQKTLADNLNEASKQLRKKTFRSRLLVCGAMVLTGFLVHDMLTGKR